MIKHLLRWVSIKRSDKASVALPWYQMFYLGKTSDAISVQPYGFHGNMPVDTLAIAAAIGNQANKAILGCVAVDRPDLQPGEVAVYHPASGAILVMRNDGSVTLETGAAKITAQSSGSLSIDATTAHNGDITVNGNVTVTGTLNVQGTTTLQGKDFLSHQHGGVQSGSSNTTGVV